MNRFFKQIGIASDIKFNELDQKTFDLVSINNLKVGIPHGLGNFEKEIIGMYSKHAQQIKKYFEVVDAIFQAGDVYEKIMEKKDVIFHPIKHRAIIKYENYTLHDLFEELKLPQELRAVLAGQAGNLCASPKQVSLCLHSVMQAAFCKSAHFPKKGMEFVVNKIAEKITENKKNKIITNCLVKKINCDSDKVVSIETEQDTIFGDVFISNIDPKQTYNLINNKKLSGKLHKKMHYDYSNSAFTIYLGLKDVNLKKHGFGKMNIWHHSTFDIDKEFRDQIKRDDFSHPWLFISTPSMLTDKGIVCPKNNHTMEILTFVDYDYFKNLYTKNKKKFEYLKNHIYEHILDIIDEQYLPNIRKYIDEKIIHTPIDIENILHSPKGNVYGCSLTPENYNIGRINSNTFFENMHFVGATSSYPGVMGVTLGGMDLYKKLENK
jgi:phytoene dehydrogenase-like protein